MSDVDYKTLQLKAVISQIAILQQMYANHEPSANEVNDRNWLEKCIILLDGLRSETARADWLQKQLDLQTGDPIARSNEDDPWNDGY